MERQELIGYLREMDERALSPLDAVLARTEAIGDPELPSEGDLAILGWMGETFRCWEQQFPLAEPLAGELRRLKPLLAAVAVSDPAFLVPGAHPVHRLMDCIQQAAVGWQPELGRAAQPMLQLVGDLAHRLLEWFDSEGVDLARICSACSTMPRPWVAHWAPSRRRTCGSCAGSPWRLSPSSRSRARLRPRCTGRCRRSCPDWKWAGGIWWTPARAGRCVPGWRCGWRMTGHSCLPIAAAPAHCDPASPISPHCWPRAGSDRWTAAARRPGQLSRLQKPRSSSIDSSDRPPALLSSRVWPSLANLIFKRTLLGESALRTASSSEISFFW